MSMLINGFSSCINKFFEQYLIDSNNKQLFIFQGFPLEFYQVLANINLEIKHISGSWDGNYPDVKNLDGLDILSYLLVSTGCTWCFYEEFIALTTCLKNFKAYKGNIYIVQNDIFSEYYPVPAKISREELAKELDDDTLSSENYILSQYYSDYKIYQDDILLSFINKHYESETGINIPEIKFFETISRNFAAKKLPQETPLKLISLDEAKYKLIKGELHSENFNIPDIHDNDFANIINKVNYRHL
ncbi:MAG: hypothetical protein IJS99_04475 [Synergistaceae bacterium]|nr:hypothetical protein [Synergistaceae bacterium]